MSAISLISILALILTTSGFVAGYASGVKRTEVKVFKNCLRATINPHICLQYMKFIKDGR